MKIFTPYFLCLILFLSIPVQAVKRFPVEEGWRWKSSLKVKVRESIPQDQGMVDFTPRHLEMAREVDRAAQNGKVNKNIVAFRWSVILDNEDGVQVAEKTFWFRDLEGHHILFLSGENNDPQQEETASPLKAIPVVASEDAVVDPVLAGLDLWDFPSSPDVSPSTPPLPLSSQDAVPIPPAPSNVFRCSEEAYLLNNTKKEKRLSLKKKGKKNYTAAEYGVLYTHVPMDPKELWERLKARFVNSSLIEEWMEEYLQSDIDDLGKFTRLESEQNRLSLYKLISTKHSGWGSRYQHSEQLLLRYLSAEDVMEEFMNSTTRHFGGRLSRVQGLVFHIHTQFAPCMTCAASLFKETENQMGVFREIQRRLQQRIFIETSLRDPQVAPINVPILVLVSSWGFSEGDKRDYPTGHDGEFDQPISLHHFSPYFAHTDLTRHALLPTVRDSLHGTLAGEVPLVENSDSEDENVPLLEDVASSAATTIVEEVD